VLLGSAPLGGLPIGAAPQVASGPPPPPPGPPPGPIPVPPVQIAPPLREFEQFPLIVRGQVFPSPNDEERFPVSNNFIVFRVN